MAKVSTFRARRRSAAEKRVLLPLQREIGAIDGLGRRKYLRDFTEAYSRYERVINRADLFRFCTAADTLLVSDFHALDSCQFFLCELMENLAQTDSRPNCLLLEAIFTRDQHIVDEWQAGSISDDELRHRLRFSLDWGYEWEPFLHTLKVARGLNIPVFGADCAPRGNMRRIAHRDRHAADTMVRLRRLHSDTRMIVLFGESHLAPAHLPREIAQRLPAESVRTVLQNVDALYFRSAGEFCRRIEALQVNATTSAVFNATPVEKWQSYRLCIERWREESCKGPDYTPALYDLIDALLDFLHIDRYAEEGETSRYFVDCYPEVANVVSLDRARAVLARAELNAVRCAQFAMQVAERGSCYVPEANLLVIHRMRMLSATRDVAAFVHHACRSFETAASSEVQGPQEAFYSQTLEHALENFGARVLYPSHPVNDEADLLALYAEDSDDEYGCRFSRREHTQIIDSVMLHRDYELHSRSYAAEPKLLQDVFSAPLDMQEMLSRHLGQLLGSDLYRAYLQGRFSRSAARALVFRKLRTCSAREMYFAVSGRVRRRGLGRLAA